MMFLSCPANLDPDGGVPCGLPAEVVRRFRMHSTDGPLEAAMIRCPVGHWFDAPVEALASRGTRPHDPSVAPRGPSTGRDGREHDHYGRGDCGGLPVGDQAAGPEWVIRLSNVAPAVYLGYPASLWVNALRPGRPHGRLVGSAPGHLDGHGRVEGG
jgi:hypothetical protein